MMDYLLGLVEKTESKHIEARDELDVTEDDVRAMFIDVLVSGTLTTSIALTSFILFMVTNPTMQDKARYNQYVTNIWSM